MRTAALLGGLALVVVAAACGTSSNTTTAGSTDTTTGGAGNRQAYRDCLAQNGVNLPQRGTGDGSGGPPGTGDAGTFDPSAANGGSGGPGGGAGSGFGGPGNGTIPGVDAATMQKAQDACQDLRPTGGFGGGAGERAGGATGGTAFAAYASCMQDHGVTIRGRGASTDTTTGDTTPPPSIDRNSAAFKAANTACAGVVADPGTGPGPG